MNSQARVIDTHVHLFEQQDLARIHRRAPYNLPAPFTLQSYLDQLLARGITQGLINNVHLSILPDSENVFTAFEQLDALKRLAPESYRGFDLIGTLVADPGYATAERLAHPQVKGVRIVLHDRPLSRVSDDAYLTPDFLELWKRLRDDQHVHLYAQHPGVNLAVLRQLPVHLNLVIDHLGTCKPHEVDDFTALLQAAAERGRVWFKGPGYRTANDVSEVVPFADAIVAALGPDALILGASDAPHVGEDAQGLAYQALFDPVSAYQFSMDLGTRLSSEFTQTLDEGRFLQLLNPKTRKS